MNRENGSAIKEGTLQSLFSSSSTLMCTVHRVFLGLNGALGLEICTWHFIFIRCSLANVQNRVTTTESCYLLSSH